MALPMMEDDLKIIQKLGKNPGTDNALSSEELKQKFDEGPLAIQKFLNEKVIPYLNQIFGNEESAYLPKTGGTMAGLISMAGFRISEIGTPINSEDAVPKSYADKMLSKDGGKMTGSIDMDGNGVSNLPEPVRAGDAVPKSYAVDMKQYEVTLSASGWVDGLQTVNADGVTADKAKTAVITTAAADSAEVYLDCGVQCSAQGAGTLTFSCKSVPASDLTIHVLALAKGGW